jgi:hypothetical protein
MQPLPPPGGAPMHRVAPPGLPPPLAPPPSLPRPMGGPPPHGHQPPPMGMPPPRGPPGLAAAAVAAPTIAAPPQPNSIEFHSPAGPASVPPPGPMGAFPPHGAYGVPTAPVAAPTSKVTSVGGKKVGVVRQAAGKRWVDPTLTEWPENDFRIFVGNLGNEVGGAGTPGLLCGDGMLSLQGGGAECAASSAASMRTRTMEANAQKELG